MHKLLEKLDRELHKYADKEGELTKQEWDVVFEAIEARKDLLTSMAMEGEDRYGNYDSYSGRRMSMMMDPDLSYSYGWERPEYSYSSRRIPLRHSSYGSENKEMIDKLYAAMNASSNEEEKLAIKKIIDKFEC